MSVKRWLLGAAVHQTMAKSPDETAYAPDLPPPPPLPPQGTIWGPVKKVIRYDMDEQQQGGGGYGQGGYDPDGYDQDDDYYQDYGQQEPQDGYQGYPGGGGGGGGGGGRGYGGASGYDAGYPAKGGEYQYYNPRDVGGTQV